MPKKCSKTMSIGHHKELGQNLKKVESVLRLTFHKIAPIYGISDKNVNWLRQALRAVDNLRSGLDNKFCKEYPEEDYRGIYYGKEE